MPELQIKEGPGRDDVFLVFADTFGLLHNRQQMKISFFRFFRLNFAGGGLSDNGEKLLWRKIKQSLTKFDILEVQTLKKFGP